jgi:hypothetical protein
VDLDELFPLSGGLVERLEDLTDHELLHPRLEESFECLQGLRVLRGRADDLAVRLNCLVDVPKAMLMDAAEPILELERISSRLCRSPLLSRVSASSLSAPSA